MMEYKGYLGAVEYDDDDRTFHGRVINIRDVITFEGDSVKDLSQAFRESVDDYLAFCKKRGEAPDKPFSGRFLTRMSPELHRQATVAAARDRKSLNAWLQEVVKKAVSDIGSRGRKGAVRR
jgi:predicted HicB family RNase H-like nuclease